MPNLSRRDALRRIGRAAAVVGGSAALGVALWDQHGHRGEGSSQRPQTRDFRVRDDHPTLPQLAIASTGTDPLALTQSAVDALGGMARFISRGDVVTIKPNIGWDRTPLQAANTNPLVIAALVRMVLEAGAKRVTVTDASCNEASRSFQRSGIWKAAHDAGAEVVLPAKHRFRTMRLNGEVLDEWPIFRPVVDADKVINAPVVKHHNLAKYTGALKNWYGLLGGRRNRLHQKIDVSIADLATFMQPTLTVVDATRVLMRNGPQGGNIADTKALHKVIASVDQIAADAYSCQLIGVRRDDLGYLDLCHQRGLGTKVWEDLRRTEV
ncbi:MAG: cytoplasmic protein [Deltaproteobacteria bacterium]|nr:MAG: cytoplasmic protein [Deltaproteobacteria bacterium]